MCKVILHTDGARAYRGNKCPGVKTDWVKHKRPNSVYVALWRHVLPKHWRLIHKAYSKKTAAERRDVDIRWVKRGTQIILVKII